MKLSEVCFREAVRLPGTQRRELLVRAKDVEAMVVDAFSITMSNGSEYISVPLSNVLWWQHPPAAEQPSVSPFDYNAPVIAKDTPPELLPPTRKLLPQHRKRRE